MEAIMTRRSPPYVVESRIREFSKLPMAVKTRLVRFRPIMTKQRGKVFTPTRTARIPTVVRTA